MLKSFKFVGPCELSASTTVPETSINIDWSICILCQQTSSDVLQCPADTKRTDIDSGAGYDTLATNIYRFREIGCLPVELAHLFFDDDHDLATKFKTYNAKWHKNCKDKFNNTKLQRAEKRKSSEISSHNECDPSSTKKATRHSSEQRTTCFFCGKESGELHRASTFHIDEKVRQCASILNDNILLAKLTDGDMIAQDATYHIKCLSSLYKKADKIQNVFEKDDTNKQYHGIALAELLAYLQESRTESDISPVFRLADLTQMYEQRLEQLGSDSPHIHSTRLKDRILANFPDIQAHKQGRDILLVCKEDIGTAIKRACDQDFDNEGIILAKAAQIVRRDIIDHKKSIFTGTFPRGCQQESVPQSLTHLVGMIMGGPNIETQCSNTTDIQAKLTVSQLLLYNCHIRRRTSPTVSHYHSTDREPPLPMYLGLLVHAETRKRGLIDKLFELGLSISYDRVLAHSTVLGNNVCDRFEAENVVCPSILRHSLFTTSAVDNIDHNPSSTSAHGSLHGTSISLFQHPSKAFIGTCREMQPSEEKQVKPKTLASLPESYRCIPPLSLHTKEPGVPAIDDQLAEAQAVLPQALSDEYKWLSHTKEIMKSENDALQDMTVSWAAFHATHTEHDAEKPLDLTSLLPLFEEPSKSAAMIRHAMDIVGRAVEFLNPGQIPIMACDQPLFTLAKQIQWNWPQSHGEEKMVIMFGGLHIEMAAQKTLGKWLEDSGWTSAITEANIASPGTADSFLSSTFPTRTRHAHQVTASSLYILMHDAYEDYAQNIIIGAEPEAFDVWCDRRKIESPQFHYWSITLEFELTILMFVRSLRCGNFQLYKETLAKLIPWFFSLDHPNYARWLPIHLRDMQTLVSKHPSVESEFQLGKFVVHKTHHAFSALPIDHAHEQNNKLVKGDGGAIGLTENSSQLLRWMVCGPEVARCIAEFEDCREGIKQAQSHGPDLLHHEQAKSVQKAFSKQVASLCRTMEEMGNPFKEQSDDLIVLDTRDVADTAVSSTVRSIQQLGQDQFSNFVQERLERQTTSLYVPLKRNKLPLFRCQKPKSTSSNKDQITSLKKNCSLFSQLYISCQVRAGDIAEFFRHENHSYPPSLSHYGEMRSGTKSDLVKCLETDIPSSNEGTPSVDAIMLDGAAIVHMVKPCTAKTFLEYSQDRFLPYIKSQLKHVQRVDIIWDEYRHDSLKALTRKKRGKGTRRRVQPNTKLPGNWDAFLRIDQNKTELFAFLAEQSVSIAFDRKRVISTASNIVIQNQQHEDIDSICPCTHEEADTRLLLHAANAAASGYRRVLIRTVDTDVVILSVAMYANMALDELWVGYGTGKHFRYIPVHAIAQSLGPIKSRALLMLHAFTGCDQTSFFMGKGKKTAWETSKVYPDVITTFAELSTGAPPTEHMLLEHMTVIERFVILMYDRTSSSSSVDETRKELFTQKGRSIDMIPPTSAALLQHTKRAVYQAGHCWSQALLSEPLLPDPGEWGWVRRESHVWQPIWSTISEAAASCQEFLKCCCQLEKGCKGRCKCVMADMPCTALCKCTGECERD